MNEHLLATTCLLLASKFYEIDDNLIISSDVQTKFKHKGKFLYQEYQRAEIQLLLHLKWDAHITTVLDILQAFAVNGMIQSTDLIKMDSKAEVKPVSQLTRFNHDALTRRLKQICSYLADWEIQNSLTTRGQKTHLKALALLLIGRRLLGIQNSWNIPML